MTLAWAAGQYDTAWGWDVYKGGVWLQPMQ